MFNILLDKKQFQQIKCSCQVQTGAALNVYFLEKKNLQSSYTGKHCQVTIFQEIVTPGIVFSCLINTLLGNKHSENL